LAFETTQKKTAPAQSVKEMQTWSWTKLDLRVAKKTKKSYLTYIKATIYSVLRCNTELQTK